MQSRIAIAAVATIASASSALADTTNYTYDALGRLTASSVDRGYIVNTSIAYDAAGNRVSYQVTGGSTGTFTTMAVSSQDGADDSQQTQDASPVPMSEPVIAPYLKSLDEPAEDQSGN